MRCSARNRARGPGSPGGLVNDAPGSRATVALLKVREEGRGGRGSGEAEAARCPEEHTLKSGLPSEQIARTVDALAALSRVSTLKLSTPRS